MPVNSPAAGLFGYARGAIIARAVIQLVTDNTQALAGMAETVAVAEATTAKQIAAAGRLTAVQAQMYGRVKDLAGASAEAQVAASQAIERSKALEVATYTQGSAIEVAALNAVKSAEELHAAQAQLSAAQVAAAQRLKETAHLRGAAAMSVQARVAKDVVAAEGAVVVAQQADLAATKALEVERAKLTATTGKLTGIMSTLKATIAVVGIVVAATALKAFAQFEYSLQQMVGLAGVSQKTVDGLTGSIMNLAAETGRSSAELADALYFIFSSGIKDAATAMEILRVSAIGAMAGLGETKTIADLLTSVMNAYADSALSAGDALDVLTVAVREGKGEPEEYARVLGAVIPTAAAAGVAFADVAASLAAITREGVPTARAATGLRFLMSQLYNPTQKAAGVILTVFESLDEVRQILAQPQGILEVLTRLRQSLPTQEFFNAIGGIRALIAALPLVGQNSEDVIALFDTMTASLGTTDAAARAMADTLTQRWREFTTAMSNAGIVLGEALAPFAKSLLTVVSGFFQLLAAARPVLPVLMALVGAFALMKVVSVVQVVFTNMTSALVGMTVAARAATIAMYGLKGALVALALFGASVVIQELTTSSAELGQQFGITAKQAESLKEALRPEGGAFGNIISWIAGGVVATKKMEDAMADLTLQVSRAAGQGADLADVNKLITDNWGELTKALDTGGLEAWNDALRELLGLSTGVPAMLEVVATGVQNLTRQLLSAGDMAAVAAFDIPVDLQLGDETTLQAQIDAFMAEIVDGITNSIKRGPRTFVNLADILGVSTGELRANVATALTGTMEEWRTFQGEIASGMAEWRNGIVESFDAIAMATEDLAGRATQAVLDASDETIAAKDKEVLTYQDIVDAYQEQIDKLNEYDTDLTELKKNIGDTTSGRAYIQMLTDMGIEGAAMLDLITDRSPEAQQRLADMAAEGRLGTQSIADTIQNVLVPALDRLLAKLNEIFLRQWVATVDLNLDEFWEDYAAIAQAKVNLGLGGWNIPVNIGGGGGGGAPSGGGGGSPPPGPVPHPGQQRFFEQMVAGAFTGGGVAGVQAAQAYRAGWMNPTTTYSPPTSYGPVTLDPNSVVQLISQVQGSKPPQPLVAKLYLDGKLAYETMVMYKEQETLRQQAGTGFGGRW